MDKVFNWIKNNIIFITIMVVAFYLLPLIIINIIFKIASPYEILNAEWEAGDLLEYWGSFLTFIGTVGLGALALWQNHILSQKTDAYNMLFEKMEKQKNMPILDIIYAGNGGRYSNIELKLKNLSENLAKNISVSKLNIKGYENSPIHNLNPIRIERFSLEGKQETVIHCNNPSVQGADIEFSFIIGYKDKYDESHWHKCIFYIRSSEGIEVPNCELIDIEQ